MLLRTRYFFFFCALVNHVHYDSPQIHEAVDGDIDAKLADVVEPGKTAGRKAADKAIEKVMSAYIADLFFLTFFFPS